MISKILSSILVCSMLLTLQSSYAQSSGSINDVEKPSENNTQACMTVEESLKITKESLETTKTAIELAKELRSCEESLPSSGGSSSSSGPSGGNNENLNGGFSSAIMLTSTILSAISLGFAGVALSIASNRKRGDSTPKPIDGRDEFPGTSGAVINEIVRLRIEIAEVKNEINKIKNLNEQADVNIQTQNQGETASEGLSSLFNDQDK